MSVGQPGIMAEFVLKVAAETTKCGPLQRYERLRQRMARRGGGSARRW